MKKTAAFVLTILFSGVAAAATAAVATTASAPTQVAPAVEKAASPATTVDKLQNTLIAAMRGGKKLGYKGRYDELKPVVQNSFDFPFIARLVLGQNWAKLDAKQQQNIADALLKLSVSSYAHEFDSYDGDRFVGGKVTQAIGGSALVAYKFYPGGGGAAHRFDYQLVKRAGSWKIANVIVDGVSDLALKRGQYRELFKRKGYQGLIDWLDKQIAANAA